MNKLVLTGILLFFIFGCTNSSNETMSSMAPQSMDGTFGGSPDIEMAMVQSARTSNLGIGSKIQTNGNLSIEVNNLAESISHVEQLIIKYEGVKISSNTSKSISPYININLLIPSIFFNEFLEELKGISESIVSENIYTNDVTEEYIDITATLNVMKNTEERFISLLSETKSVEEIIQVEKELMRIRAEIDSLEGRKNYLTKTTKNSELNLHIAENTPLSGNGWSFKRSFESALRNLISFAKYSADFLINIFIFIPVVILLILLLLLPYKIYKNRKNKINR